MQRDIPTQSTLLSFISFGYKLLLLAYPTRFRREYGVWMAQVFRDETRSLLREGNMAILVKFLTKTIVDLLKTVFIQHIEELFNIQLEDTSMSYHDTISDLTENPEALEHLYQKAIKAGEEKAFQAAIDQHYQYSTNNLLLAGWFYRLHYAAEQAKRFLIEWRLVIPLALLNGLLIWWFTDEPRHSLTLGGGPTPPWHLMPVAALFAAPFTALFILIYFTRMGKKDWRVTALTTAGPILSFLYVLLTYPQTGVRPFQEQYLQIATIHLPILTWVSVGVFFLLRHRDAVSRMRFLLKSIEIIIIGGIFSGVLFAFLGITIGLFQALDISFSENLIRLLFGGGLGFMAVIAPAIMYNPTLPPAEQSFGGGIYRLASAVMQVLLPLTIIVLAIYIAFIPANFYAPFDNREVLITYNVMLFAVVGLLVGATILRPADIDPLRDKWLRRLIIGVAVLTLIVSLYALSAIIYRTINDHLTPNRLTIIGWNIINVGLLIFLLLVQFRAKEEQWLPGLYRSFSIGTAVYALWTAIIIIAIPWLFGIDQTKIDKLPAEVREIIYTFPDPILLKCYDSPHIYLLEDGEKRWIEDIETFDDLGYQWREVRFVGCKNLRDIPNGIPIPEDAGPVPQPQE